MKLVVLGGGISGLSAAWYAKKKYPNAEITLLEKTDRFGGWIRTTQTQGFLFEEGPRTFPVNRASHLLELIHEVGLSKEIISSDRAASRRYLWYQGKLRSIRSFFPSLICALFREPFVSKTGKEDESIYEFFSRRLGKKLTNTLIDAMTIGIYSGDIHKLSIRSCYPHFFRWEKEQGSLLKGAVKGMFSKKNAKGKGLFTLQRGMESLIFALKEQLQSHLICNAEVTEIRKDGVLVGPTFYPADQILSALPGSVIGHLTHLWTDFEQLDLFEVHLVYSGNVLPKKGFGYLVPTEEKENLLGMIWESSIFPQQNRSHETRVTLMMRKGSVEGALDAMKRHLGVKEKPIFSALFLAKNAIPQFHVGYAEKLSLFQQEVKEKFPSLVLLGNYVKGASVDACIAASKNYFEKI